VNRDEYLVPPASASPPSVISKIEAGEGRFDLLEAGALCAALGITLAEFVGRLETALPRSRESWT
jgi:hypothetical protein